MNKIKIAIVDDHQLLSDAMKVSLERYDEIEVLFMVKNLKDLESKLKWTNKPELILMDYALGDCDGEDCIKFIRKEYGSDIKILGISMHSDEGIIYKMIQAGANGFISKTSDMEEMYKAIKFLQDHDFYFNDMVSKIIIDKVRDVPGINKKAEGYSSLSEIDLAIIKSICQENSNEQIASDLNLSINTINTYRKKILKKLGCKNTAGLVSYAFRNGIHR